VGRGELLSKPEKLHDDCRLISMAVRKRWAISDEVKGQLVDRLAQIAADNPDDEVAIKAINALRGMESQNQKDEQISAVQSDRNRFLAIAERLGLGAIAGRVAESGSGDDPSTIDGTARQSQ